MATVFTKLNVSLTDNSITKEIDMVQGDTARGLDIFISDEVEINGSSHEEENMECILFCSKPSGLEVSLMANYVAKYNGSNAYEVRFNGSIEFSRLLQEVGRVKCQVYLKNELEIVTSFAFYINVFENKALVTNDKKTYPYYQEELRHLQELKDGKDIINEELDRLEQVAKEIEDAQTKFISNVYYGTNEPSADLGKDGDVYVRIDG